MHRQHSGIARACRLLVAFAGMLSCCGLNSGCSVMMAARAPDKKDLSLLQPGVNRSLIVTELGPPLQSESDETGTHDIYSFKQGYSAPVRTTRFVGHLVADISTFALWELVGWPLESVLQGEEIRARVDYDQQAKARRVEYFTGGYLAHGGPTRPIWMSFRDQSPTLLLESPGSTLAPQPNLDAGKILPAGHSENSTQTSGAQP